MTRKKEEIAEEIASLTMELKNIKGSKCEVYSRVVGYYTPTSTYNKGKKAEYAKRTEYVIEEKEEI